jgi:type III restriction enzyme
VPDFIVRLANGLTLVLEIKGQESEQDRAKRAAMKEWVAAVNAVGGFGRWACDVAYEAAQVHDIITRHEGGTAGTDAALALSDADT